MPGHIFISYSRVDTEFVTRLINDLSRQGLNIWMDQPILGRVNGGTVSSRMRSNPVTFL